MADLNLDFYIITRKYPIGSRVRLSNDDQGYVREVEGYQWTGGCGYLLFTDGGKLAMSRLDLIEEVP